MPKDVKNKIFGEKPTIEDTPKNTDGDRLLRLYDKLNKCNLRIVYILSQYDKAISDLMVALYDNHGKAVVFDSLDEIGYPDLARDYKEYSYLRVMVSQFEAQIDAIVGGYR